MGNSYLTDKSCAEFTDIHAIVIRENMAKLLKTSNFFSVLMDGSTIHKKDKELIYINVFDKGQFMHGGNPTRTFYVDIAEPEKVDSRGLHDALTNSLHQFDEFYQFDELMKKFIGMCSDGASVNTGVKNGLGALLREQYPHLYLFWCVCHRLELAVQDAFKGTLLFDIKEMLMRLYYLYDKSPKKLRSLKELHKSLEETLKDESEDSYLEYSNGIAPLKSHGTRWIAHVVSAMKRAYANYGIYLTDIESLAAEKSSKDTAKLKGYLKIWKSTKYLLGMGFFLQLLTPVMELSLSWQRGYNSIVELENKLTVAKNNIRDLLRICEKGDVLELPYVSHVFSKLEEVGEYQSYRLTNTNEGKVFIQNHCVEWCKLILDCFDNRFGEDDNSQLVSSTLRVLDCKTWIPHLSVKEVAGPSASNDNRDTHLSQTTSASDCIKELNQITNIHDDSCCSSVDDDERTTGDCEFSMDEDESDGDHNHDANSGLVVAKSSDEMYSFVDKEIDFLSQHFLQPLLHAKCEVAMLKSEFKQIIKYTEKHIDVTNTSYTGIWRMIYQTANLGVHSWENILLLVELCFSIPVSNAKVESGFSIMRMVETDWRARLTPERLGNLLSIYIEGPPYEDNNSERCVELFFEKTRRPNQPAKRNTYVRGESEHAKKRKVVQQKIIDLL